MNKTYFPFSCLVHNFVMLWGTKHISLFHVWFHQLNMEHIQLFNVPAGSIFHWSHIWQLHMATESQMLFLPFPALHRNIPLEQTGLTDQSSTTMFTTGLVQLQQQTSCIFRTNLSDSDWSAKLAGLLAGCLHTRVSFAPTRALLDDLDTDGEAIRAI